MKLHDLDVIRPTALQDEIERRMTGTEPRREIPDPNRLRHRVVAGVVAVVVFLAAVAVASGALIDRGAPQPANEPWSSYPPGWTELPTPPQQRFDPALVWTGSQLLSWGGKSSGSSDAKPVANGWSFDPATGQWSAIPEAPEALVNTGGIWSGTQALFWGERPSDTGGDLPWIVMAYDPGTSSWREFDPSPHGSEWGGVWVWAGDRLIAFGGGRPDSAEARSGDALDPATGTWEPIADAPLQVTSGHAVWTGTAVVVVGSALDTGNHATTSTAVAEAYTPSTDTWRTLPSPPLSPQASAAVWFQGNVLGWDYASDSATFLTDEARWQGLGTLPLDDAECSVEGVAVDDAVFAWNCGYPDAWYPGVGWSDVTGGPAPDVPVTRVIGTYGSATSAGPVAIVYEADTVSQDGRTYVGLDAAPQHLWVWRPASDPPAPRPPTKDDAERIANNFISAWDRGDPYLPTLATTDVLDRCRTSALCAVGASGSWSLGHADETERGTFEITAGPWADGALTPTEILTIGPGTTADGRDAPLVVTDVRPA
jgi:hypothetical protein